MSYGHHLYGLLSVLSPREPLANFLTASQRSCSLNGLLGGPQDRFRGPFVLPMEVVDLTVMQSPRPERLEPRVQLQLMALEIALYTPFACGYLWLLLRWMGPAIARVYHLPTRLPYACLALALVYAQAAILSWFTSALSHAMERLLVGRKLSA